MRRPRLVGAADNENGWAFHHRSRGEEPPQEELPRLRAELIEPAAAQIDRHDARRLVRTSRTRKSCRALNHTGRPDPPREQRAEHGDVERDPPHTRDAVAAEVGADRELMRERERDREVRVQVDRVPRLPRELAARRARGRHAHCDQEPETDDRHEHVGIVRDEVARLRDERHVAALRVPERREHGVPDQQPHRREAVPAVPHRQAIETDAPLEPRDARHQQQLEQHRVGTGERGELAGRGRDAARPAQRCPSRRGGTTARRSPRR